MLQAFAGLSAAGMEPGYDKVNQDYICIQPLITGDTENGQSYMFAVLDGHGAEGVLVTRLPLQFVLFPITHSCMLHISSQVMSSHAQGTHCTRAYHRTACP